MGNVGLRDLPRPAVPALVAALGDARDAQVRASAAEALGRIGPPASVAIPALVAALKHAAGEVSDAAASALVMLGLVAAPALIEAVTDDDARLQPRATTVLMKIVTAPPGSFPSPTSSREESSSPGRQAAPSTG